MSEITSIQWTHHTVNLWSGCVEVSPGCTTARLVSPGSEYFAARWEIIAPA